MSKNFDSIIESVEKMSVLDLAELVKALEVKFGVSAAAMSAPVAAAGESAEAAAPAQEKSEFKVILKDFGADKIAVIKAVRQVVTMGLGEAKKLVESAPVTILEAASKDDSKKAKELLEGAGAKVELA